MKFRITLCELDTFLPCVKYTSFENRTIVTYGQKVNQIYDILTIKRIAHIFYRVCMGCKAKTSKVHVLVLLTIRRTAIY